MPSRRRKRQRNLAGFAARLTGCTLRTLLDLPCPEPGCWGALDHGGLHSDGSARWSSRQDWPTHES